MNGKNQNNNYITYSAYEKQGKEILRTLTEIWNMEDETQDNTPPATLDEIYLLQDKKLEKDFRYFKHDKELTPFTCKYHEYLKIPENKENAIPGQTAFGDDGSLTHD